MTACPTAEKVTMGFRLPRELIDRIKLRAVRERVSYSHVVESILDTSLPAERSIRRKKVVSN